jgi:hypothetical protein
MTTLKLNKMEYVAYGTSGGIMAMNTLTYIYPNGDRARITKSVYIKESQNNNLSSIDTNAVNQLYEMFTDDVCSKTHNIPSNFCHVIKIKKGGMTYKWVYSETPSFLENIHKVLAKY